MPWHQIVTAVSSNYVVSYEIKAPIPVDIVINGTYKNLIYLAQSGTNRQYVTFTVYYSDGSTRTLNYHDGSEHWDEINSNTYTRGTIGVSIPYKYYSTDSQGSSHYYRFCYNEDNDSRTKMISDRNYLSLSSYTSEPSAQMTYTYDYGSSSYSSSANYSTSWGSSPFTTYDNNTIIPLGIITYAEQKFTNGKVSETKYVYNILYGGTSQYACDNCSYSILPRAKSNLTNKFGSPISITASSDYLYISQFEWQNGRMRWESETSPGSLSIRTHNSHNHVTSGTGIRTTINSSQSDENGIAYTCSSLNSVKQGLLRHSVVIDGITYYSFAYVRLK